MWPNAKISVMGPEQAAGVLTQVSCPVKPPEACLMKRRANQWSHVLQVEEAKRKRDGRPWPDAEKAAFSDKLRQKYLAEATATYSSARLWCVCRRTGHVPKRCRMILHSEVARIDRLSSYAGTTASLIRQTPAECSGSPSQRPRSTDLPLHTTACSGSEADGC